jgi:hypothetical protein
MKVNLKMLAVIICCVMMVFILTNPGRNEFASHLRLPDMDGTARDKNFVLWSEYSMKYDYQDDQHLWHVGYDRYIGILGNFYKTDP